MILNSNIMSENATAFIATELIKQTEVESSQSLMWIISSMNRFLILNPEMSLLDYKRIIGNSAPETYKAFNDEMKIKNLKIIV
tara:strand:+ start:10488 stop:10736 length:249 start_codon:yes stop_codon:yes gene_type:complete